MKDFIVPPPRDETTAVYKGASIVVSVSIVVTEEGETGRFVFEIFGTKFDITCLHFLSLIILYKFYYFVRL